MTDAERDEDLVRRFRAGEPDAFTEIVRRHQQRVYSLCLRMLGEADAAADVAQDTFLTVLRKLESFRGDAAFTTWLHRVAVNACYDELRRKRRRPILHVVSDDGPEHDPGPSIADHADEVVGTSDAAAALASIPEEFRVAVVLADVQDLPYDQIAEILEVPVGTVKSRVHRGRVALAAALGIHDQGEPVPRSRASEQEP
ncbi:MAG TPA: sigma-70 family RNA polymerase sigma factor [Candidatus Limnocylindrales bacterium]|nr:sigma-70 family RNA polymerase sigma factor [Candidatus Limnocylindrales bacterium]